MILNMKGMKKKNYHIFKELGFQIVIRQAGTERNRCTELRLDEIDFEMVEEVTETMFAEQNAFYVEVLEDNYHYADIIGFHL